MFDNAKNAKRIISISAAALCMLTSFRIAPYSEISTDAADDVLSLRDNRGYGRLEPGNTRIPHPHGC